MRALTIILILFFSGTSFANVTCTGKIKSVYKWDNFERISILMDNAGARWIRMPTDSDEAMALMAFAANKPIVVAWVDPEVNSCNNGWSNNKPIKGWWAVNAEE